MRTLLGLFVAAAIAVGCSKEKIPHFETILKIEDHYLKLQCEQAIKLVQELRQKKDLPERFFSLATKVYLRAFKFRQALEIAFEWKKINPEKARKQVREILLGYIRYFTEFENRNIQFDAIQALGELKDRDSKELIMSHFETKSRAIRVTVCYAMCLLGDEERALPYLVDRSKYSSLKSRFLAALFLSKLDKDILENHYRSFLRDPDDSIRGIGIKMVAKHKIYDAKERLTKMFRLTADKNTKMLIAQTLVQLGETSMRDYLYACLENPELGISARIMLLELGESKFVEPLQELHDEMGLEERYAFYRAMLNDNRKEFVREKLTKVLNSLVGDTFSKKMALELLSEIGNPEDLELIKSQLSSPFEEIQLLAAKALLKYINAGIDI